MWTLILASLVLVIVVALAARFGPSALASLLFLIAFGARIDLFVTGSLYGSTYVWAADAIVAALGFWMTTTIVSSSSSANSSWEARLTTIGVAVAIPASLLGAVELAAPVTPHTATAPACAGASVAGGRFLATTPAKGINARSGPDTSYPQVQRFAGNCTLSFDGYCIGEPADDITLTAYPDQRWLILHRPWQSWPWRHMPWGDPHYAFMAAAEVQSQSAESALGPAPDRQCSRHGGWRAPNQISLTATLTNGVASIRATAPRAEIIGLSIMTSQPLANGSDPIFPFTNPAPKRTDSSGSIPAVWYPQTVTGPAVGRPATLTLVASVCLGPAVPDPGNYALQQFSWNGKTVTSAATPSKLTRDIAQRVQAAACRVAPDYPKGSP